LVAHVNRIRKAYERLLAAYGPQYWWPSESSFETALGAILTQGTAWANAERAIAGLRCARALSPGGVLRQTPRALEDLVRPAGFHTRKAVSITELARISGGTCEGWDDLLSSETEELRERLLQVPGIGDETADAIVLYAARRCVFVVDKYTRRFAVRHCLTGNGSSYGELQRIFTDSLPCEVEIYSEYHALLVQLGKTHCRPTPRCRNCPLRYDLPDD
jgi:endonuclease-3 related protein